ncbi:MAG: hypothetical protein PF637_11500 [Spirochaetes bacterium]|nr:hypothetical protein [Spirochaetota bacterium]
MKFLSFRYHFQLILKLICVLLISLCAVTSLYSFEENDQKMLIITGNSPVHAGRAFTGVTDKYINGIIYNPASVGDEVSTTYSVNFSGYFGGFSYPSFIGVVPNQYFKTAFEYSMLDVYDTDHIDTHILRLNIANYIGNGYYFGVGLAYYYLGYLSNASHFGLTAGLQKQLPYSYTFTRNFGIYDIQTGLMWAPGSLSGAGKTDYTSLSNATLGSSFLFFRSNPASIRFYQEVSMTVDYFQLPFKFGLESQLYDNYFLRAGIIYPDAYSYGDFTLGVGYAVSRSDLTGRIDYAVAHKEKYDFNQYIGASFSFSSKLDDSDDLRLRLKDYHFSPNGDSIKDTQVIEFAQYSNIKSWELSIIDRSGAPIRSIDYRTTGQGSFIERVLATETAFRLPDQYEWDGRDNSGAICDDGLYYAELSVQTDAGRVITKRTDTFILDTLPPAFSIHAPEKIFIHETDKFFIEQRIEAEVSIDDEWSGVLIKKSDNTIVRRYDWKAKGLPTRLEWDGNTGSGQPVEEGVYLYRLEGVDQAGNRTVQEIDSILVVSKIMRVDVVSDKEFYSANDSKAEFILYIPRKELVNRYEIFIQNEEGENLEHITNHTNGELLLYDIPKDLPEGRYAYFIKVYYSTGDNPESPVKYFNVDTTAPLIKVQNDNETIKPDPAAVVRLIFSGSDRNSVASYMIELFDGAKKIAVYRRHEAVPEMVEIPLSFDETTFQPLSVLTWRCVFTDSAGNSATVTGSGPSIAVSDRGKDQINYTVPLTLTSQGDLSEVSKSHLFLLLNDLKRRRITIASVTLNVSSGIDSELAVNYINEELKRRGSEAMAKRVRSNRNTLIIVPEQ